MVVGEVGARGLADSVEVAGRQRNTQNRPLLSLIAGARWAENLPVAAEQSSSPPKSLASHGDFDRPSGPDDVDKLFVRADTVDISSLRPGWRHVTGSSRHTQPGAAEHFVFVPPTPSVPLTAPDSPSNGISKGLIAVGTVVLAVVIALPSLLLRSGDRTGDDAATQQAVVTQASPAQAFPSQASPAQAKPALQSVVKVTPWHWSGFKRNLRPRSLAAVLHARLLESEQRAATPLEQTTPPVAYASSAKSDLVAPPSDARTVSAGFAAPAISPSTPPPAPVDGALQPGASRYEAPTAPPDATSTPSPAIAATPSPVSAAAAADERLVAAALRRFALAYERLDANAVAEVWPHVDQRVLSRAFDSIESQQVYFERCDVQISGSAATASCGGWMNYVPKVGKKDPRSVSRQWDFVLQKGAGEWQITTAAIR